MTYAELKKQYPDKEFSRQVFVHRDNHYVDPWSDSKEVVDDGWEIEIETFSDHSVEAAELLITNLQKAIEYARNNP